MKLIPTIIQDTDTKDVLMLGFMNDESLQKTKATGNVWFWSRRRKRLWMKGETSGNVLAMSQIWIDCDTDTLLIFARQTGVGTCHTGDKTCFRTKLL